MIIIVVAFPYFYLFFSEQFWSIQYNNEIYENERKEKKKINCNFLRGISSSGSLFGLFSLQYCIINFIPFCFLQNKKYCNLITNIYMFFFHCKRAKYVATLE